MTDGLIEELWGLTYPCSLLRNERFQVSAKEDPPQKQLGLKLTDVNKSLTGKWLQLYWPDDGKWWPCQVLTVDSRKKTVTLLYETGKAPSSRQALQLAYSLHRMSSVLTHADSIIAHTLTTAMSFKY